MRRNTSLALCLSLLACVVALAQESKAVPRLAQTSKAARERAQIEKLGKQFSEAFNKGDVAAVAAMYAEDAIALPPDSDLVRGRAAIQKVWQGFLDIGGKSMEFTVLDLDASGDLIVETGLAKLQVAGAGATDATVEVKYVVVWKKQKDGSWKITRDIWNAMPTASITAPAATAPTPAPHH